MHRILVHYVPLRATSSESVPVMELYNMYNSEDINKSFAITYLLYRIKSTIPLMW